MRPRRPLAVRRPQWIAGLAAVVGFAVACLLLGTWQWHRRAAAEARTAVVEANYDRSPVALEDVVGPDGQVDRSREWRPIAVRGEYAAEATVLLRNRPLDGVNGFLVAVPLTIGEANASPGALAATVWIVRGWIPAGDDAGPAARTPAPPGGPVEVVARIRPAEPAAQRVAPPGQAYRLHPTELAAAVPVDQPGVVQGYGVLDAESPSGDAGLVPLSRPEREPGPHLAYAIQWWLFAGAALTVWLIYYRRAASSATQPMTAGPPAGAAADRGRAGARPRADPWSYRPGG